MGRAAALAGAAAGKSASQSVLGRKQNKNRLTIGMNPPENPQKPLVSVMLIVKNGEPYITKQIDSILAQTYDALELIICDDFSTDRTPEIAQEYMRKDSRVRWVRNERNIGVSLTFERWSIESRGEFISPSDADDYWLPEKVEKQVAYLMAHPEVDLVFSDDIITNEDLSVRKGSFQKNMGNFSSGGLMPIDKLLVRNYVPFHVSCFRRTLLPKVLPMADYTYDAWVALVASSNHPIGYIGEFTVLYRQHQTNMVGSMVHDKAYYFKRLNSPEFLQNFFKSKSKEVLIYDRVLTLGGSAAARKALNEKIANLTHLLAVVQAANFGSFLSRMAGAAWVILKSSQKYHMKQWGFLALSWGAIKKLKLQAPVA